MNYREKMRKFIECPQFGNLGYGRWSALNIEQRELIKRLLDEMDSFDEAYQSLYLKNKKLKSIIKTLIKEYNLSPTEYVKELIDD